MSDNEKKEIASLMRKAHNEKNWNRVALLIDELDPPRPEPGTVVWWTDAEGLGYPSLGQISDRGSLEMFGTARLIAPHSVKWWPARFLAPGEVAVRYEELVDAVKDLEYLRPEDVRRWLQYYFSPAALQEAEG